MGTATWIAALVGCVDFLGNGKDEADLVDPTDQAGDDDDEDNTSTTWTTDSGWTTTTWTTPVTGDPTLATVYDIQGGAVAEGTLVEVRDLVVTAAGQFGFYAQERNGGPGSGIWVFGGDGWEGTWPVDPGDRVAVVARYDEYQGLSELDLQGAASPGVQVLGTVPVPEPALVPIADLQGAATEAWESVLIRVEGLVVTAADLGDGEFEVGDGPARLLVDDQLHLYGRFGTLPPGATVHAVAGVLNHDAGAFKLEPRSDDDLEVAAATVFDLQDRGVPLGTEVEVYGVTVTAAAYDGLYVQDPAGGEYSGVWVYLGSGWDAVWAVAPGDEVHVWGRATEYYDLTEIDLTTSASPRLEVAGAGAVPAPAAVSVADLGEPWEGVLVEIADVVVSQPTSGGAFVVTPRLAPGTAYAVVDDRNHAWSGLATLAVGDRFGSIAGTLRYSFGEYKLEPRGEFDVAQ